MKHVIGRRCNGFGPALRWLVLLVFTGMAGTAAQAQTNQGPLTLSIVSGNNQTLTPGQTSQPFIVKAVASNGAPAAAVDIDWTISGATGSLASATTRTDSSGVTQNTASAILPAVYQVTASAKLGGSVTFTFNNAVANLGGLTPAQASVAHAIDRACPALATSSSSLTPQQQDFLGRCSEVVVRSGDPKIPSVLDQMNNNKAQPQNQLASNINSSQLNNLSVRFAELRQGAQGFSVGGMAFNIDGNALSLGMLGDAFAKDSSSHDEAGASFSRWGFFVTGMYTSGGFSSTQARPGFDFDNAALTAGVDYRFSDSLVGGVAFGYNHDSSDLSLNAGGLDVDGYNLTGYFTWYHANDFYVEGSLGYSWLDYDLKRNIIYQIASVDGSGGITSVNQVAKASPSGDTQTASLTLGHDFNGGAWAFSPYLRGTYAHINLDGFRERIDTSGPGSGLATAVDARSANSVLGVLGGRLSYTINTSWGVLVPNAVVEWNHEFRDDPQTVVYRFLSDPTQTPVVITDTRPDSNFFNLGLGLNAVFAQGRSGYVYYEHVAGYSGAHINRYTLGFRMEF
ncbi:MAG TPA: autotransporter domain-containing protein [Rudaea sp.]